MTGDESLDMAAHIGRVGRILQRGVLLEKTARCPECGEPVAKLTDATYQCQGGPAYETAPHRWIHRSTLEGDVKWWHGRMPLTLGLFLWVTYAVAKVLDSKLPGGSKHGQ